MQKSHNDQPLVPVILSGGSGTRLWPFSRQLYPKQFIPLTGEETLFQATANRSKGLEELVSPVVVGNDEHRFMLAEQLRQIGIEDARIILEPVARNTAPALCAAALEVCERYGDAVMLVLPADHVIHDIPAFHEAVHTGIRVTEGENLVTFGIVPDRAETGYGYIKQGQVLPLIDSELPVCKVDAFVEKPDLQKAKEYFVGGGYLWNSGMFMFRASVFLAELQHLAPEIHSCCSEAYQKRRQDINFTRLDSNSFAQSPKDSIDYAVMENTQHAVVIPLRAGWSDVGSWHSLWQAESHNEQGNVELGDILAENCSDCYLNAAHRMVAAIGLKDMVVIETTDAVLVAPRERTQDVRLIVERLKASGRGEALLHRKVYRPWGTYEGIDASARFQVKKISVEPGHSLSLQMHHHRAEHWIVVKGTARVKRGDEDFLISENESTYIPLGIKHRLENPGKIPLEIIEVQSGSYLGEDDILRYDDHYGR